MYSNPNRWKGFVLGALGGIAGVIVMNSYWKAASAIAGGDPRQQRSDGEPQALDSISLVGTQHQEDESITAAMARIGYVWFTGEAPNDETKNTLSTLIHYGISMGMGGVYGAVRGPADVPDIAGGLALGIGLWCFGDELAMPLLGLADGPTAYPLVVHAHGFGAHIPYGLATAATTQLLYRLIG